MTLPYVKNAVKDNGSAALALGSELHVKIGVSSAGPTDGFSIYTDPDQIASVFGVGPLVSAAAFHIATAGTPVAIVRVDPLETDPGSIGPITGDGTSPAITDSVSGPLDSYQLLLEVVKGGALGTATLRASLDDGDTWGAPVLTAPNVTITGTGITLDLAAGTYVAGDRYTAEVTGPTYTTTGLTNALNAAMLASSRFRMVHAVGFAETALEMAAIAASVNTLLNAAAGASKKYTRAFLDGAPDTDANTVSAFEFVAAERVGYAGGFADLYNPFSGGFSSRPATWALVSRIMQGRISRDPGAVADGSLDGVFSIARDEFKTPLLDDARINTLRTWVGRVGFFVTRGRLLAQVGSDFTSCMNGFVMDAACAIAYDALLQYVNEDVIVNAANGTITELEAQSIEAFVTAKLRAGISDIGDASDVDFVLNRNINTLTTESLKGKTRILPLGYTRYIDNELSFRKPGADLTTTET